MCHESPAILPQMEMDDVFTTMRLSPSIKMGGIPCHYQNEISGDKVFRGCSFTALTFHQGRIA